MNVSIFLISVLGLTSAQFYSYNGRSNNNDKNWELRQYLEQYGTQREIHQLSVKMNDICPGSQARFEMALNKMKSCADDVDETSETACSIMQNYFARCLEPVIQAFEECLPEESKTIPSTMVESIISASKYLCKTDGEHVFELGNSCALNYNYALRRCQRRITTKIQQYQKETPTKNDLCQFYQSFKPCFHNHITNNCGHEITRQTWLGVYDALGSPCVDVSENEIDGTVDAEIELLEK